MNLVVALTGATGVYAAKLLVEKSPWPVTLVASEQGRLVFEQECGDFAALAARATETYADTDLTAPIAPIRWARSRRALATRSSPAPRTVI
jgi:3-polyprenyl-4-hydroxybenzoate decarboxylase